MRKYTFDIYSLISDSSVLAELHDDVAGRGQAAARRESDDGTTRLADYFCIHYCIVYHNFRF
jgi:hypothetical protein